MQFLKFVFHLSTSTLNGQIQSRKISGQILINFIHLSNSPLLHINDVLSKKHIFIFQIFDKETLFVLSFLNTQTNTFAS